MGAGFPPVSLVRGPSRDSFGGLLIRPRRDGNARFQNAVKELKLKSILTKRTTTLEADIRSSFRITLQNCVCWVMTKNNKCLCTIAVGLTKWVWL